MVSGLSGVVDLLYGAGVPMTGFEMSNEEAVERVCKRFRFAEYCLVRDWIWVDLDVSDEQCLLLEKTGRQPSIIYAHTVIYDSARRWDVGDFVRTSPLHAFHDGFLFQTWNTVYVLLGDGLRKRAALEAVGRIF